MNQTIALIDDDRNILTSISMALEKEGFKYIFNLHKIKYFYLLYLLLH